MKNISLYLIPIILLIVIVIALIKRVNAYDAFLRGAKEGVSLLKEVFPTLLGMLVVVGAIRSSGIVNDFGALLSTVFHIDKSLSELVPLVIFRPISGSASISVFSSVCKEYGADSLVCKIGSVIEGSTDTTLYVLSLYFSSVGVTKWKHALKSGLIADVAGIGMGLLLSIVFLGI